MIRNLITRFLQLLYGAVGIEAFLNVCLITPGRNGVLAKSFPVTDIGQIINEVVLQRTKTNVYLEVCLQEQPAIPGRRGNAKGAKVVPGFWIDVDVAGENHKSTNYPESQEAALSFVNSLPWNASLIISTGGGVHVYFLFEKPFVISSQENMDHVAALSREVTQYVRKQGSEFGWDIDNTSDLARLLRIPGTLNHKSIPPKDVVIILDEPSIRYSIEDFEKIVVEDTSVEVVESSCFQKLLPVIVDGDNNNDSVAYPEADVELIERHCTWMRHCKDDVAVLKELDWFAACSVWARCINGREAAHERSEQYSKYCRAETDLKIDNALNSAPMTCSIIEAGFGGGPYCVECFFREQGKSPISLGNTDRLAQAKIAISKVFVYSANNPKVIFEEENLEALGVLKLDSRGYYVEILDKLKKLGIPKGELQPVLDRYMATSDLLISDFEPYEVILNRICINKPTANGTKTEILSGF